jgi:hypothetical protein
MSNALSGYLIVEQQDDRQSKFSRSALLDIADNNASVAVEHLCMDGNMSEVQRARCQLVLCTAHMHLGDMAAARAAADRAGACAAINVRALAMCRQAGVQVVDLKISTFTALLDRCANKSTPRH